MTSKKNHSLEYRSIFYIVESFTAQKPWFFGEEHCVLYWEVEKWKSDAVERLGGTMQADAFGAHGERWFRERGKPVCQIKFVYAASCTV